MSKLRIKKKKIQKKDRNKPNRPKFFLNKFMAGGQGIWMETWFGLENSNPFYPIIESRMLIAALRKCTIQGTSNSIKVIWALRALTIFTFLFKP